MLLKTPGFDTQVKAAAERARGCGLVADAVRIAATLDGMVPEQVGRAALGLGERMYLELAEAHAAGLDTATDTAEGELLLLTETGRLRVVPAGERPGPEAGAAALGTLKWQARPESLGRLWDLAEEVQRLQFEEIHRWMATLEPAQVHARLDAISHALVHMAPVMLYVGERCYSNLGRFSNLPGRSLAPGAEGSVLTALRDTPVPRWKAEDATFVACVHALISSGSPVRAEEFNGIQLAPDVLREFLRERISAYGEPLPDTRGLPAGAALDVLSGACARARAALVADGAVFYREINGASLHKRERRMAEPVTWAELPPELTALLAEAAGRPFPYAAGPEELGSYTRGLVERVTAGPVPAGFTTAYEGFLHRFFETVAEALDCDVVMGRGPKDVLVLHSALPAERRAALATRDFYCCVAAGRSFRERFGENRAALATALSAYSARMRYNTWHYLPHSMSWTNEEQGRDDWFFAPGMPDITNWSDQHHTGHVAFGVRHALRVPLGIVLEGRYRPGLYDLRLMRTDGDPFELAHLRTATAIGQVQATVHQAAADLNLTVGDFDNAWYRDFHAS
ncbi:hypothetical protein OG756_17435 [Streptomyces sp. NBC_01310]|uniref:hypothetical protein n=1 Tax=Streptomyces sp. NBC_01310 TaxID=2903820 RepID=UPI0035B65C52|nr:hypothetical protein OG756_17435 [Streptomyces sp. NBC_01310]